MELNEDIKTEILIQFILKGMAECSEEEFKLISYFLAELIYKRDNKLIVYMNELLDGIDEFPKPYKKISNFNGTGLKKKEILIAIESINNRSLLHIEPLEGSNYQFTVTYKLDFT